jgi:hypothetical protein
MYSKKAFNDNRSTVMIVTQVISAKKSTHMRILPISETKT